MESTIPICQETMSIISITNKLNTDIWILRSCQKQNIEHFIL